MTVLISGYLPSGNDESLKYEKTVPFEYISQVMEVMCWKKGGILKVNILLRMMML